MTHYVVCSAESSMERDKFMSPKDARDFGIIDKILDHPPKLGDKTDPLPEGLSGNNRTVNVTLS